MTSYLKGVKHYSTTHDKTKGRNKIENFHISTSKYSKNSVKDIKTRIV